MRPRILRAVREMVEFLKTHELRQSPKYIAMEIQDVIGTACEEVGCAATPHMGCTPSPYRDFNELCFKPELEVWSRTRLHFTAKPCSEQEEVYCIDCENLVIYRHKIG